MLRLSSNLTIFFKLFLPTAWTSFFSVFLLVIFISDVSNISILGDFTFKLGFLVLFLLFFTLIYYTIFQLKRVEYQNGYIYVTNYFKTVKFPVENIKKITTINFGVLKVAKLHLVKKGMFGNRIAFIIKRSNFLSFIQANPQIELS